MLERLAIRRARHALTQHPDTSGILLDFDGTLSSITERPTDATALSGVAEVLTHFNRAFGLVAVVSGRSSAQVAERIEVPGLTIEGLYGAERDGDGHLPPEVIADVVSSLAQLPAVRIEAKGRTVAVHLRGLDDDDARTVEARVRQLATLHGLELRPGRRVIELTPIGASTKGDAVRRLLQEHPGVRTVLYVGDDHADLDAFDALDEAASSSRLRAFKAAVRSTEAPVALASRADLRFRGPRHVLAFLQALARSTTSTPAGGTAARSRSAIW